MNKFIIWGNYSCDFAISRVLLFPLENRGGGQSNDGLVFQKNQKWLITFLLIKHTGLRLIYLKFLKKWI